MHVVVSFVRDDQPDCSFLSLLCEPRGARVWLPVCEPRGGRRRSELPTGARPVPATDAPRGVAGETPVARAAHHGRARRQWGSAAREARARGGGAPAPVAVTTTASLFVGAFALLDFGAASGPAMRAARGRVLSARDRDRSWRRRDARGSVLSISSGDPGRRSQGSGGRRLVVPPRAARRQTAQLLRAPRRLITLDYV